MVKVLNKFYLYDDSISDSAHHTFFEYLRRNDGKRNLEQNLVSIRPDNIFGLMLRDQQTWQTT